MTLDDCLKSIWARFKSPTKRSAVLSGYAALGAQYKFTLADIAMRNGVFSTSDTLPGTADYRDGRRDAALELLKLAKVDPATLLDLKTS